MARMSRDKVVCDRCVKLQSELDCIRNIPWVKSSKLTRLAAICKVDEYRKDIQALRDAAVTRAHRRSTSSETIVIMENKLKESKLRVKRLRARYLRLLALLDPPKKGKQHGQDGKR